MLTVAYYKKIDTQNSKSLTDSVVSVLEFALHDGGVSFCNNYTAETNEEHPSAMLANLYDRKCWLWL